MPKKSKHTEAGFLPNSMDSLCLRVTQMNRSRDVAIFMPTTTDNNRQQQTMTTDKPITLSLEHVRGVINNDVLERNVCALNRRD